MLERLSKEKEISKKADDLLGRMTLEEKVGQMHQCFYIKDKEAEIDEFLRQGKIGSIYSIAGGRENVNRMQQIAVEQSRLRIPFLHALDALHGFETIFPTPLAWASTWDTDLLENVAEAISKEVSEAGHHWIYAPMLDIARDPRWGRIAEGSGEDPFLGSAIAAALVKGFQKSGCIMACAKHFVAYGACEGGRDYNTSDLSERTLREIYLPPFKSAIDAGVESVMSAYCEFNGIPVTGNNFLLKEILREEWGYQGIIVSDYESINEMVVHGSTANLKDAAQKAVFAGVDVDLGGNVYSQYLAELVREGKVPERLIDESVSRILRTKLRMNVFDHPYFDNLPEIERISINENHKLALETARNSVVLLKNENKLLPLCKSKAKIAVIGPLADNQSELVGCWAFQAEKEKVVSVLEGLKCVKGADIELLYAEGCEIESELMSGFDEAKHIASESDVVVLVVGEKALMSGEGFCRSSLGLPGVQDKLVEAVCDIGVPVILVQMNGRPLAMPKEHEKARAVIEAWQLGYQSGNAISDVIFGNHVPSGKLPVTFPRSVGQLPVYYNHKNTGRPPAYDKQSSRYIDIHHTPHYPFGYGLSYTNFEYSNLKLSSSAIRNDDCLIISIDVKNIGDRQGQEVVQLYLQDIVSQVTRPVKELKGFQKVMLEPDEIKKVSFSILNYDLGFYGMNLERITEPGRFRVWVGGNSSDGLSDEFEVLQ